MFKKCICQNKKDVYEQFERKMNQDVNGNRKGFWKKVSKMNGGKVEVSNRIKDGNGEQQDCQEDLCRRVYW